MATKKSDDLDTELPVTDLEQELAAQNLIKSYVIASVGASIVPVPLFDIAAVVGIQLRMIQKLSQLYGHSFSERTGKNILTALVGGTLGYGAGYAVAASAFKVIPGIGWMVGVASLPLVAGGSTYAVGRTLVRHFEDGGSMLDFNADKMRAYYREQFEKGKEVAAKAKDSLKNKGSEEASAA